MIAQFYLNIDRTFCNAHKAEKEEKIIDRQLNKNISISFNRNNT